MTRFTSTNSNFPLSWDPNKVRYKDSPPPEPKGVWKLVRAVLIGFGFGVVACIIKDGFGPFIPVFLVVTLLGWIGSLQKPSR